MHILWVPSWYPSEEEPLNGSFFAEQRKMLMDAGHTVGILNVNARSIWQQRRQVWMTQREGNIYRRDVLTIPLELFPGDVLLIRMLTRRLAREYQRAQGIPDVIHAHSAFPGIIVAHELCRIWGVPFGFTEHRPSSADRDQRKGRFHAIRKAVHASSFNITVSSVMAQIQGDLYEVAPFKVCALPAPEEFFMQPLRQKNGETMTFVHVSHMDRNKRVEETLSAFSELLEVHPNVRLLLIGGGPERVAELRSLCSQFTTNVSFLGQVPRDQIVELMAQGDCLILVSAQEAGGTVMAEAQCLGMPVLASATSAGTFMVRSESGIVVPIDEPGALLNAMKEIVEGIDSGRFDSACIRQQAEERFSAHAFVAFHEKCYLDAQDV